MGPEPFRLRPVIALACAVEGSHKDTAAVGVPLAPEKRAEYVLFLLHQRCGCTVFAIHAATVCNRRPSADGWRVGRHEGAVKRFKLALLLQMLRRVGGPDFMGKCRIPTVPTAKRTTSPARNTAGSPQSTCALRSPGNSHMPLTCRSARSSDPTNEPIMGASMVAFSIPARHSSLSFSESRYRSCAMGEMAGLGWL